MPLLLSQSGCDVCWRFSARNCASEEDTRFAMEIGGPRWETSGLGSSLLGSVSSFLLARYLVLRRGMTSATVHLPLHVCYVSWTWAL